MKPVFYQVGGSVRDSLLGLSSKDIDYAVEADSYESMRQAILDRGGEIFLETPDYLTIRAKVPFLGACDFVLCRKDGKYKDGRRPQNVTPGTIYDDLARRDFTVNAIARRESDGSIYDPFGGVDDLKNRWLKCVGNPRDRFQEDGLRLLRAIRFAITKDLSIDDDIDRWLRKKIWFRKLLKGVSTERIREELLKCFQHDTVLTLLFLTDFYKDLGTFIFCMNPVGGDDCTPGKPVLWLKPTLEGR